MSAFTLDARAGDTFKRTITWLEDNGTTPISLTGASVEWSLKANGHEFQFIDSAQASITSFLGGQITLVLTPVETRTFFGLSNAWRYEVTVTLSNLERVTLLFGALVVAEEVVA